MKGGTTVEKARSSIFWVRRKNGTWWPAKILCNTQNNNSSRFPIKLLGRDDASVDWFNVEKSGRIKAFRCGEFDDCIKKAESSKQAFTCPKHLKYSHREAAIRHALQLEKLEQEKLKRPAALISGVNENEEHGGSAQNTKRSRRVYNSPIDSKSFLEKSVHSQSSTMISAFTNHAAESSSTSSSSLKRDSQSSNRNKETTAGRYALRPKKMRFTSRQAVKKCKPKGKLHNQHYRSRSVVSTNKRSTGIGHKGDPVLVSCQKVLRFETKSHETSAWDVNQMSQPSHGNSRSEDTSCQSHSTEFTTRKNSIRTLIDVHITVQGTYRGQHTPLVSLMSGLNQKAIIGRPINVEVVGDSSEILVKKESSDQKNRSRMPQLVWRKSKRTPVCYTTSTSATEDGKVQQGCKNMSKNKSRTRFLADGLRCKHDVGDIDSTIKNSFTCVPVKDIFIKLIEALEEA